MINPFIYAVLLLCHIFIQLFWTFTSRGRNVESFLKTWTHIRSIPIVVFEFFGFGQLLFLRYLDWPISHQHNTFLEFLGLMIALCGVFLASWAKVVMGTNWGRPAQHNKQKQSQLVTRGPFSFSRNPIYVGLFLLFIGQQLILQSYWIIGAIVFAWAIKQAVNMEEPLLEKYFGKEYQAYKKRVHRFL